MREGSIHTQCLSSVWIPTWTPSNAKGKDWAGRVMGGSHRVVKNTGKTERERDPRAFCHTQDLALQMREGIKDLGREMAQRFRVLPALPEASSLVPSTCPGMSQLREAQVGVWVMRWEVSTSLCLWEVSVKGVAFIVPIPPTICICCLFIQLGWSLRPHILGECSSMKLVKIEKLELLVQACNLSI